MATLRVILAVIAAVDMSYEGAPHRENEHDSILGHPTTTLCFGEKGSIWVWSLSGERCGTVTSQYGYVAGVVDLQDLKPWMVSVFMYIEYTQRREA